MEGWTYLIIRLLRGEKGAKCGRSHVGEDRILVIFCYKIVKLFTRQCTAVWEEGYEEYPAHNYFFLI